MTSTERIVIDCARSWRSARDAGKPSQPALYARLKLVGGGILVPVLDSLFRLVEAALQRRLCAGAPRQLGMVGDEPHLLHLLSNPNAAQRWRPLEIALASTRILLCDLDHPLHC